MGPRQVMIPIVVVVAGVVLGAQGAAAPTQRPAAPAPAARPAQPPAAPATPTAKPDTPSAPVPFPADARIAIIDMAKVLNGSKLGQAGQQVLKAANDKWTATLQSMAARLQTLQQEYQSGVATLSASALAAKKGEVDKAQLQLQYQQSERDADMQQVSQRLSDDFDSKVGPILDAIRTERKIWMIFDLSDMGGITIVGSHPGLDLSAEVIRRLDAQ